MTKQEVIDAGIDISGDDNFNSFKYTIEADFDAAGVVIDKVVSYNVGGTPVRDHVVINVAGNAGVVINSNTPTYVPGLGAYVVRTETVEEEMYMIIYGKCKWLKEFYDVQLIVVNNDTQTLSDCTATLNIPEGLTLCKGDETQEFGDLKPKEVKTGISAVTRRATTTSQQYSAVRTEASSSITSSSQRILSTFIQHQH